MRTNIIINDDLIEKAMKASGARTKRAAVEAGLRLLIDTYGQGEIRKLRGKIQWDGNLEAMRTSRFAEESGDYQSEP